MSSAVFAEAARTKVRSDVALRIGLVTTEFVSEYGNGGGLGNYLARLAVLLREAGHVPEVFVLSEEDKTTEFEGVRVQRVKSYEKRSGWVRGRRLLRRLGMTKPFATEAIPIIAGAFALSDSV